MEKQRDFAVDIIKFIAVFLIINSHADMMYPRMSILATGGAIGDCLFLFVSGYTIFLGKMQTFGNYYKRRINRIMPSVFAALAFIHIINYNPFINVCDFLGGEFIEAIMVYYVLLYIIRKYVVNHIKVVIVFVAVVTLVLYVFWFPYKYETSSMGLYGISTLFRWVPYFAFMLMGAYMGLKNEVTIKYSCKPWVNFVKMVGCLILFYCIQLIARMYPFVAPLQILTLIPLMGIVLYMYHWCKADFFKRVYMSSKGNKIILFVSGLCLESYLIQYNLFTDAMNSIWPINILIVSILILACSYLVRCLARIFSQTFKTEDYDWRKVFSIV